MASCVVGSLAPDIDLKGSKAGSAIEPASTIISALFGHRTICHSPILWWVIYTLITHYLPFGRLFALALVVGAVSHLVLDMLNKKGISLFWPIPTRFWVIGIECGGAAEKAVFVVLWLASIFTAPNILNLIPSIV